MGRMKAGIILRFVERTVRAWQAASFAVRTSIALVCSAPRSVKDGTVLAREPPVIGSIEFQARPSVRANVGNDAGLKHLDSHTIPSHHHHQYRTSTEGNRVLAGCCSCRLFLAGDSEPIESSFPPVICDHRPRRSGGRGSNGSCNQRSSNAFGAGDRHSGRDNLREEAAAAQSVPVHPGGQFGGWNRDW